MNELEQARQAVSAASKETHAAQQHEFDLMDKYHKLITAKILGEGMLKKNPWILDLEYNMLDGGYSRDWQELFTVWEPSWEHASHTITNDIRLHVDDGKVSIHAYDPESLYKFVQDHNLAIETKGLERKVRTLTEQLDEAKQLLATASDLSGG